MKKSAPCYNRGQAKMPLPDPSTASSSRPDRGVPLFFPDNIRGAEDSELFDMILNSGFRGNFQDFPTLTHRLRQRVISNLVIGGVELPGQFLRRDLSFNQRTQILCAG